MLEKIPSLVGEALKGVRPGLDKLVSTKDFPEIAETIAVDSTAFGHGAVIPSTYTEDGHKISPPLAWRNCPAGTQSVVLIVEDADSPTPEPLVHAMVLDLSGGTEGSLAEGELRSPGGAGQPHRLGKNSFMKAEYLPPDPPSGHGPHRYAFQVYALNSAIPSEDQPGRQAVVDALKGHVLAKGVLIGTYERP